ncbi:MAG: hypothetical protein LBF40_07880 [Deltaproteobacteria bacterium]|jgi:hypothetical protein|nr:hypothetical protein [Deltaproteobacteria bacterium]
MADFGDKDPPRALAGELSRQLDRARESDSNPWRRGRGDELISLWGAYYPRAARLALRAAPLGDNGWLTAERLLALAELSERRGSGLMGLHPQGNLAMLLGVAPAGAEGPLAEPTDGAAAPDRVGGCPLWGPCLGDRAGSAGLLNEISKALNDSVGPEAKASVCGCPRDCRSLAEGADILAVMGANPGISLWLGARHRPFLGLPLPRPWRAFPDGDLRALADFAAAAFDRFLELRLPRETLPELHGRLGEEAFADLPGG